jgi:3-oxoacyl-(acyl-carrier-protein) synthase
LTPEVVITGVGAVSALGVGARTLHERWSAGVVGIEDGEGAANEFDPTEPNRICVIAGRRCRYGVVGPLRSICRSTTKSQNLSGFRSCLQMLSVI